MVWLAPLIGDNIAAFLALAAVTVVIAYTAFLFAALSVRLINQNTFSRLSRGIFDTITWFNPAKTDGKND